MVLIALTGARATAQAQPAPRSTIDGVYTPAQAKAGADVYARLCQSCHTAASHTGAPVPRTSGWDDRSRDLFGYITDEMPKTEPGSLTDEEYTRGARVHAAHERHARRPARAHGQ